MRIYSGKHSLCCLDGAGSAHPTSHKHSLRGTQLRVEQSGDPAARLFPCRGGNSVVDNIYTEEINMSEPKTYLYLFISHLFFFPKDVQSIKVFLLDFAFDKEFKRNL